MPKKRVRIILHVDMDHFFTAVEEREQPEIKGKAVVVGADPKEGTGRGVVSTSNYEARKYGVKSGIPIGRAWRLCPQAIFLPVNYKLYKKVSTQIMTIIRSYADKFEDWGFDEAFLDVTQRTKGDYKKAEKLAQQIKKDIYKKESLTCSIGVGPNKLVAKIGSDFKKPDGLTVVRPEEAKAFLAPLNVRRLLWVGKKIEGRLNNMGIKTIGDLANYDASVLVEKFGVTGTQLYLSAQGIDNSEIQEQWERKSINREITFEADTSDPELIIDTLDAITEDLHQELVASNFTFKTTTIKIRYENFETHTHGNTFRFFTDRLKDIQKSSRELIQNYLRPDRKIRLIGVKLSNLLSTEKQKRLTD
ncbi:MAG: DNA polymerase IV [Candidatus Bathyarchaeota archaeon]|nr:DNA polymerase IV [Candidatus Bathyarchaeum sp.]